jgi:subtilisin family serine protease
MDLVVRRLRADHRVESAQAVQRFELLATGDDPYAHLQHGAATLHAVEAHRWATGRGVRVAVIDTGVDIAHPDLAGRVVRVGDFIERRRRSFTRDIHGTAVAGVLAAVANNGEGISGIAPEAEIFAFRACWPRSERSLEAACDSYSLAQALDVAVTHGAQVVNLSLSGPDDPLLARILRVALERGATVVAALQPARDDLGFPASLAGVIAVAAEGDAALVRPTPGRTVFVAPGSEILAPVPGGGYDFFSGSSMATAQVAGVIALLLERDPTLTARDVAALLAESTGPAPRAAGAALPAAARPGRQDAPAAAPALSGPARVDACRAVARLAGVPETCGGAVVAP